MGSIAAETICKVYTAFLLDEKCRILPMTRDDLELNYLMVAIGIPKMINCGYRNLSWRGDVSFGEGTAVVLYKRKISSKQIDSNYSPCLYSLLYRGICINRSLQYAQPHPRSSGL
ncbi:hypothetical protein AAC387_Pa07g2502 [Persea americana]